VEVPTYPDITKLLFWKTNLMRSVVIAANNPDSRSATEWICETRAENQTYESLGAHKSYVFTTLDIKLAQAMVHMMNRAGEKAKRYRDKVNLKTEESTSLGTIVTRRQMVWMLLVSFKTFDRSDIVYSFDHLGRMRVENNDLHEFIVVEPLARQHGEAWHAKRSIA
jgi:hypothetical protein